MRNRNLALCGASVLTLAILAGPALAQTAAAQAVAPPPPATTAMAEIIVTAQKRQENIQNVGMSIQAATGDRLNKLGIKDTADLQKVVPGFLFTPTYYGTQVFTIRGVGFQDTSLAGSPTVSVYLDEAPLPFSALTNGASLDLQRVEVLKGPQGTLFGENATGGAINYVANKPTDHYEAGADLTYGRFQNTDISGFVSGPLADGFDARLALRYNTSGAWQHSYGPQQGQSTGGQDFLNGRLSFQWKPNDKFTGLLTLNGWHDRGYTQMGQLFGIAELSPLAVLAPAIANYPLAPHNDQAANFNTCVNKSPTDPIANQGLGTTVTTPTGAVESEGAGSVVQSGGQPTDCIAPRKDNTYYDATLRMDYQLPMDMTATSLTSYQLFTRYQGIDGGGMNIQDYQSVQHGKIATVYQELRLSGKFNGKGSWLIGANYEHDSTWDHFLQTYNASTASPTVFAYLPPNVNPANPAGVPLILGATEFALGPTAPTDEQKTDTYGVYINGEYPLLENLTLQAGARFTQENKTSGVCGDDGGDGSWSLVAFVLQNALGSPSPRISPPGTCASLGPAPTLNSPVGGALLPGKLDENNVSWRVGLNWKYTPDILLYVNVSKGYKGGSYPTVALSTDVQAQPVVQEALQAYEGGFKASLFHHQVTVDGAGFYYDYTNKQILGAVADPVFGALPALVNVPQSHVIGFEFSGAWRPDFLQGLTVTPAISYQASEIDTSSKNKCAPPPAQSIPGVPGFVTCIPGHFYQFDAYSEYADFTGERFPSAPEWQASLDMEYDWTIHDTLKAFIGANINYTDSTNTFFVNRNPTPAFINFSSSGVVPAFGGYVNPANPQPLPTNHPNDPLSVPAYTLVDLRIGVESGAWRFQVWGHNVFNAWYWTAADHVNDVLLRYTGMPATVGATLSYRFH